MLSARLPFRVAAIARTTRQAPFRSAFVAHTPVSRNVILPVFATRAYATPAKPKKGSVGATSTRRKPAATKTKTTKAAAATKKPAAARKPAATKKPAAKKKPARKVKTPEQIEKEAARKAKSAAKKANDKAKKKAAALKAREKEKASQPALNIRKLKQDALSPPKRTGPRAFSQFYTAKAKNEPERIKELGSTAFMKEAGAAYRALSSSEVESYQRQSREASAEVEREFKEWVVSHTPEQIRLANKAREALRRKVPAASSKYRPIPDDRLVPAPLQPFIAFTMELRAESPSSDIVGHAKEAGRRWKALSADEKEKYYIAYEGAVQQYERDFEAVHGVPPPPIKRKSRTAAAAAA